MTSYFVHFYYYYFRFFLDFSVVTSLMNIERSLIASLTLYPLIYLLSQSISIAWFPLQFAGIVFVMLLALFDSSIIFLFLYSFLSGWLLENSIPYLTFTFIAMIHLHSISYYFYLLTYIYIRLYHEAYPHTIIVSLFCLVFLMM